MWDWEYTWSILPNLLEVIPITLAITLAGFIIACMLGLPIALAKRSKRKWIVLPVIAVTEFIRNTPLIIQLFLLIFVLPEAFGIMLSPIVAGIAGLGIHYSTYLAEVYRSGIESVPKGQWEAAKALNYSRKDTWFKIVFPQSFPPTIPVMGNYLIVMFKETPTMSAITVVELFMTAKELGSQSLKYLEVLTLVGVIFLALSYPSSLLVRGVERHMKLKERSGLTK